MKKLILLAVVCMTMFESYGQSQNPLYLNYNSTLSSATYISSTGSHGNQPTMFFHLPYVGTTGNAIFEWDADDSGDRSVLYQFKASSDRIFEFKGWNDGKNSELWFGDENSDKFFISDLGYTGIGTTSPSAKLAIEGGDLHIGNETSSNGQRRYTRIYGYDNNAQFYGTIHSNWEDYKRTFDIYTSSSTQQLKIDASANSDGRIALLPGEFAGVGIGTLTTGSHKLAVEGSIGAREIKVEASGWSDFVFEKNYELRTLEEVEQHINENGHLPEIPSEAEVTENGINLGEMDAKLLMKIEELTLYLIEMNKRMGQLEAENAELQMSNQKLSKKVQLLENQ